MTLVGPAVKELVSQVIYGKYSSDVQRAGEMLMRIGNALTEEEFEYVEQQLMGVLLHNYGCGYSANKEWAEKAVIGIRERRFGRGPSGR